MTLDDLKRLPPGLISGSIFFAVVISGSAYIVLSKLANVSATYATGGPVCIMIAYALLLALGRFFRLRDDQSGDNLYYMGFLFTLTSLAVSLYQFSSEGSAEQIVQNFGVAIASTITGIALRILFNQMRRDPIEVEQTARLELAEASRRVRRELESTTLEFSYFRRSVQQSVADMVEELGATLKESKEKVISQLGDFASSSNRPIEEATKKSGESLDQYNTRISSLLEKVATQVIDEGARLSKSTGTIISSMQAVSDKLAKMQTPDQVIEIKLAPMVQGLSRAVNNFGKSTEIQATAIESNRAQAEALTSAIQQLMLQMKTIEVQRFAEIEKLTVLAQSHSAPFGALPTEAPSNRNLT